MLNAIKRMFQARNEPKGAPTQDPILRRIAAILCKSSQPCPHHQDLAQELFAVFVEGITITQHQESSLQAFWRAVDSYADARSTHDGKMVRVAKLAVDCALKVMLIKAAFKGQEAGTQRALQPSKLDVPLSS